MPIDDPKQMDAWDRVRWWAEQESHQRLDKIWLTNDECRHLLASYSEMREAIYDAEQAARHTGDWADQAEADMKQAIAERDALKVEVADLWTELELCRKMCRGVTLNRQVKNKPARPYLYDSTGIDFTPGATDAD